jgi:GMP synthase (glutamine-hydrolysing)
VPVLGICYGEQAMAHSSAARSRAAITANSAAPSRGHRPRAVRRRLGSRRAPVWMSHGDRVTALPPGFASSRHLEGAPIAVIADEKRASTACMFHPEVVHTPHGARCCAISCTRSPAAPATGPWRAFRDEAIAASAPGRQGQGDLRPVRRRRFRGRRGADPRGDRRPAHLRLRRSRLLRLGEAERW